MKTNKDRINREKESEILFLEGFSINILPKVKCVSFKRKDTIMTYNEISKIVKQRNLDRKKDTTRYAFLVAWQEINDTERVKEKTNQEEIQFF